MLSRYLHGRYFCKKSNRFSVVKSLLKQFLAETTFLCVFFFQRLYEFVGQIVGLVNEGDHKIDGLIGLIGEMGEIGGIGERRIIFDYLPYGPYFSYLPYSFPFWPDRYLVLSRIGQKIFEQFFVASPGYSDKFDITSQAILFRAFGNIGHARSRGLDHLIVGSGRREIGEMREIGWIGGTTVAKFYGVVVDWYCDFVSEEIFVTGFSHVLVQLLQTFSSRR